MASYSNNDGEDYSMDNLRVFNESSAPRRTQLIVSPAGTSQLVSGRVPMCTAPTRSRSTVTLQRQPGIVAMLQQQQGLLNEIFSEQKKKLRELVEENRGRKPLKNR